MTTVADVVCTRVEYLTREHGWQVVDGDVVPALAITRPAAHAWGPWNVRRDGERQRLCAACGITTKYSDING